MTMQIVVLIELNKPNHFSAKQSSALDILPKSNSCIIVSIYTWIFFRKESLNNTVHQL
jgi:hypothetical protein